MGKGQGWLCDAGGDEDEGFAEEEWGARRQADGVEQGEVVEALLELLWGGDDGKGGLGGGEEDGVSALDEGDEEGGGEVDGLVEFARKLGVLGCLLEGIPEEEADLGALFAFELADLELSGACGARPVDPTHLITALHIAQGEEVDAVAAAGAGLLAKGGEASTFGEHGDGGELGEDDLLLCQGDASGLDEEGEGELGGDAQLLEAREATVGQFEAICGFLFASGAEFEEVAFFAFLEAFDAVFDLDGEGREVAFVVGDGEGDEAGGSGEDPGGELAVDFEVFEGDIGEDAADDDEAEHHPEQEVEEVISGVDGGHTDPDGDPEEVLAFAGEADLAGEHALGEVLPTASDAEHRRSPLAITGGPEGG